MNPTIDDLSKAIRIPSCGLLRNSKGSSWRLILIVTPQGRTEPSHSGCDRKPQGDYDQCDSRQDVTTIGQSSSDHNCAKRNNRKDENVPN